MNNRNLKKYLDDCWDSLDVKGYLESSNEGVLRKLAGKGGVTVADIEIGALMLSMVSFGSKKKSRQVAESLMEDCEWSPRQYVKFGDFYDINDGEKLYGFMTGKRFKNALHKVRLFYGNNESIRSLIQRDYPGFTVDDLISNLNELMGTVIAESKTLSLPRLRTARLCRWMVREDDIDFGLWNVCGIKKSDLYACAQGSILRKLKRLNVANSFISDTDTTRELTFLYRSWDAEDPLKYDIVLSYCDVPWL